MRLLLLLILMAPLVILSKDATRKPKDRKAEFNASRNRLVEKVKDKGRSKGTNTVYRTAREFPLMFSIPPRHSPSSDSRK